MIFLSLARQGGFLRRVTGGCSSSPHVWDKANTANILRILFDDPKKHYRRIGQDEVLLGGDHNYQKLAGIICLLSKV